jgi:2-methylcitrate dehydratase PrpD
VAAPSIEVLARFATGLSVESLPHEVVERIRLCLLDGIGCILGAWELPQGRWIAGWIEATGGTPEAAIPGSSDRTSALAAAFASGCLINMLDFDDTALFAGHPGAGVIPAVLAAAWRRCHGKVAGGCTAGLPFHAPDHELLAALAVGYEVSIRVAEAGKPSAAREARVRGHATWQTFGAAAAAGRMLGLSAGQMSHALALAALHAPVPFVGRWYERPISTLKNNYGWVALGGLQSALLAKEGWTGNVKILDGSGGFWEMAGSDRWQAEAVSQELGTSFRIMDVGFKAYPACWHLGTALGSLERIVQKAGLHADAVARVRVISTPRIMAFADWAPKSLVDAQFSLPYASAMVLLGVPPGPQWFAPELLSSADVQELMSRIEIAVDEGLPSGLPGRTPARVTVDTTGGTQWSEEAAWPPGDPIIPPSRQEITRKFRRLAEVRLGSDGTEEVIDWVVGLGEPT